MPEKPILFSSSMVLALLNTKVGSWPATPIDPGKPYKSQTRRIVKPTPRKGWSRFCEEIPAEWNPRRVIGADDRGWADASIDTGEWSHDGDAETDVVCSRYRVGDTLWVREQLEQPDIEGWCYAADGEPVMVDAHTANAALVWAHHKRQYYCASIHMPRFASRISLEVTEVRCERVNAITEEDAKAEGVENLWPREKYPNFMDDMRYKASFSALWNSINGEGSWESNLFVFVYSFRRIK